ncbi:MAG: hypothetical protein ACKO6I_09255, partial [Sphingomonadales bacterium]
MLRTVICVLTAFAGLSLHAQVMGGVDRIGRMDRETPQGRTDSLRKLTGKKTDPGTASFKDLSAGIDSFALWD